MALRGRLPRCGGRLGQGELLADEDTMAKTIALTLTEDELEILVDALEADLEGYAEAAEEARVDNNKEYIETFKLAALNIQKLLARLQDMLPE
jgi:hypothetical protein